MKVGRRGFFGLFAGAMAAAKAAPVLVEAVKDAASKPPFARVPSYLACSPMFPMLRPDTWSFVSDAWVRRVREISPHF